jgi:hypothetical protein
MLSAMSFRAETLSFLVVRTSRDKGGMSELSLPPTVEARELDAEVGSSTWVAKGEGDGGASE